MRSARPRSIPFTLINSSTPAASTPARPPKAFNSAARRRAPTPATSSSVLRSRDASRGRRGARMQRLAALGEDQGFLTGTAARALGHTHHANAFDTQFAQHVHGL